MTGQNELLRVMEEASRGIAALTGIKAQLVDAGWEPRNAELMVIEIVRSNKAAT